MQKKNRLLQVVEKKSDTHNVIKPTKKKIQVLKNELAQYLDSNGYLSYSAKKKKYIILGTNSPKSGLAECPQCKIGQQLTFLIVLIFFMKVKQVLHFLVCLHQWHVHT